MDKLMSVRSEFLICTICTELYDEQEHTPRLLRCRHYYCQKCILKLIKDQTIICPKCKDEYSVTCTDINNFPKENNIRHLRDVLSSRDPETAMRCPECPDKNEAYWFCKECEISLCEKCTRVHRFQTHSVLRLDCVFKEVIDNVARLGDKVGEQLFRLAHHKELLKSAKISLTESVTRCRAKLSILRQDNKMTIEEHQHLERCIKSSHDRVLSRVKKRLDVVGRMLAIRESAKMNIPQLSSCYGPDFLYKSDVITKALEVAVSTDVSKNPIEHHQLVILADVDGSNTCFNIWENSISFWKSSVITHNIKGLLMTHRVATVMLHDVTCQIIDDTGDWKIQSVIHDPKGRVYEFSVFYNMKKSMDIEFAPRRIGMHSIYLSLEGQSIGGGPKQFLVEHDQGIRSCRGIYFPRLQLLPADNEGSFGGRCFIESDFQMSKSCATGFYFEVQVSYLRSQQIFVDSLDDPKEFDYYTDHLFQIGSLGHGTIVAVLCDEHNGICLSDMHKHPEVIIPHTIFSPNLSVEDFSKEENKVNARFGVYFNKKRGVLYIIHIETENIVLYSSSQDCNIKNMFTWINPKRPISLTLIDGATLEDIPKFLCGIPELLNSGRCGVAKNSRSILQNPLPENHVGDRSHLNNTVGTGALSLEIKDTNRMRIAYRVKASVVFRKLPIKDSILFEIGLVPRDQRLMCILSNEHNIAVMYAKYCSRHFSVCLVTSRLQVVISHTPVRMNNEMELVLGFCLDLGRLTWRIVNVDTNTPVSTMSLASIKWDRSVVPAFNTPVVSFDGDVTLTLSGCGTLVPTVDKKSWPYMMMLEEDMYEEIDAIDLEDHWTLFRSLKLKPWDPKQMHNYPGAACHVYFPSRKRYSCHFNVKIDLYQRPISQSVIFEVGLCAEHSIKEFMLAFSPATISLHAISCLEHGGICNIVTCGYEVIYHNRMSSSVEGTVVDKVFELRFDVQDKLLTVIDVERIENDGRIAQVPVAFIQHSHVVFGLHLEPAYGNITVGFVNEYFLIAEENVDEKSNKMDGPGDTSDDDSSSDDQYDEKSDSGKTTEECKQDCVEDLSAVTMSENQRTTLKTPEDSDVQPDDSEDTVVVGLDTLQQSLHNNTSTDTEEELQEIIRKGDSILLQAFLSRVDSSELHFCFRSCNSHGQSELSMVVLDFVCKRIEEEEGDNCFQVYPSYQIGNREEPVLILLEKRYSSFQIEHYKGWSLVRRRYDKVSPEASMVMKSEDVQSNLLNLDDMLAVEEAISQSNLPDKHSNITMISACSHKSKYNGEKLFKGVCIVIYCLLKGYIPYNENPFPKYINGIPVDVREGYCVIGMMKPSEIPDVRELQRTGSESSESDHESWLNDDTNEERESEDEETRTPGPKVGKSSNEYNEKLLIGTSVGPRGGCRGTLGGFVELPAGAKGFLTCAHVAGCVGERMYQPTDVLHSTVNPDYCICGVVENVIYKNGTRDEVGIDAAVVRITKRLPDDGRFVKTTAEKLGACGFEPSERPRFSKGKIRARDKLTRTERLTSVIKWGSETGLTRGNLNVKGAYCCSLNQTVIDSKKQVVEMNNQLEVMSIDGLTRFSDNGDSGSLVFLPLDDLHCIGMIIGTSNFGTCIVTPIEQILRELGVKFVNFQNENNSGRRKKDGTGKGASPKRYGTVKSKPKLSVEDDRKRRPQEQSSTTVGQPSVTQVQQRAVLQPSSFSFGVQSTIGQKAEQSNLYKKDVDDCLSEPVMQKLTELMQSVGALKTDNGLVGTAFRVGSKYVMTALHVVKNIIDPHKSGLENISLLKSAIINFSKPTEVHPLAFPFIAFIPYRNEQMDIAVLQMDIQAQSRSTHPPQPFTMRRDRPSIATTWLIGYGHRGDDVKHLEASCRVVEKNSFEEFRQAQEWTSKEHQKHPCYTPGAYDSKNADFNLVFSCYMEHGASGSPLISRDMHVVGVYTHGLPSYFFDLPKFAQAGMPSKYRFEIATATSAVFTHMNQENSALAAELFN